MFTPVKWVLKPHSVPPPPLRAPKVPPPTLAAAAAATAGTLSIAAALLPSAGAVAAAPTAPLHAAVLATVGLTQAAPVYWNVTSRAEYHRRAFSRLLGLGPASAQVTFTVTILLPSAAREVAFAAALAAAPAWMPPHAGVAGVSPPLLVAAASAVGAAVGWAGVALGGSAFVQLHVRGMYMGECFGYRCPALITGFPFNVSSHPMYVGSALVHVGAALRARSPVGLGLAAVVAWAYGLAAVVVEGPFTDAVYATETRKDE